MRHDGWVLRAAVLLAAMGASHLAAAGQAEREVAFEVTPAASGRQLVRFSIPLPRGFVASDRQLLVDCGGEPVAASWRPLTTYPADGAAVSSVRRGLVTFPYTFADRKAVRFVARAAEARQVEALSSEVTWGDGVVTVRREGKTLLTARVVSPAASWGTPRVEVVEKTPHYRWERWHFQDATWPRVIEVRTDALGTVTLVAHLQSLREEDGWAPDFGWEVDSGSVLRLEAERSPTESAPASENEHRFSSGRGAKAVSADGSYRIEHPAAAPKRRGFVRIESGAAERGKYRYLRCTEAEQVPMQRAAWRRAELVIVPKDLASLTPTLSSPHCVAVDARLWDAVYGCGEPLNLPAGTPLAELLAYHHDAIVKSAAVGDDWGNVTGFNEGAASGGVYGMNRLNHCPPIFMEGYRSGDRRLIETGVAWCDNFYDLSIWWGPDKTGGTRYNNAVRMKAKTLGDPTKFMWRSNTAVHFCTKGYDSFLIAYEETGDPRMKEALDAQVAYAKQYVHTDQGECRNIGDVRDFLRLYEWTGDRAFLDEALRLFRELRTKLSEGDLFSQGGQPILKDPPFIEEDQAGLKNPFAKPYIIGYALAGLPALARYAPDEPKLRSVVKAVADFMCESQDPVGGWRYPHPRSSSMHLAQAIEHAMQVMNAADLLGPEDRYLNAIERVLRQRVLGWQRDGRILSGLGGWEMATGRVKSAEELYGLYKKPADRDPTRDYSEGNVGSGSSAPEGIVYFFDVLRYYLQHRPAERLLAPAQEDEPLGKVLRRLAPSRKYQTKGVEKNLPVFYQQAGARLTYPMSWLSGRFSDFESWRREARARVMSALLGPPPAAPFEPVVIAEQDRGSYVARKVVFNVSADGRVLGFLLVPKGKGPFPAVLLLHDHGAKFDIGKEKMIEPWDDSGERIASARAWVEKCYGGRFVGDELAKRGYVCLCVDALNWSDRGGAGYEGQQALASNLIHMGMSLAGVIAHDDLRCAAFLAGLPEVDAKRIAAMGLSMGSFRTWQVAALSEHIAAGVSICWMATRAGLMTPGNNQTRGQSAYAFTHPGLFNDLDYPDVASIACPKPMLFYAGRQDGLFPVASVEDAFAKMRHVWASQGAGERLETKVWDVPHAFDRAMQDAVFAWLDRQLGVSR